MSPLPKKKKTAEELAALRESLGISAEGPPPRMPGQGMAEVGEELVEVPAKDSMSLPEVKAEPEKREETREQLEEVERIEAEDSPKKEKPLVLEAEEDVPKTEAKPVRSLRKSKGLTVDKPKKAISKDSGKLPTRRHREGERIPLEKPTEPISVGNGKLPARKHSDQELARLRHVPTPGVQPPAIQLANQTLGPLGLTAIYGVGVILMLVAVAGVISARAARFDLPFDWLQAAVALPNFMMIVYGILCAGVAVMLLWAAWIFFKKPISQHHSAILTIIAMLVLVFGTLYFFPELHGA